ncbi:MAG TPA: BON domain-containing protein [Acidobacteriaceae bacterium]|jgi:osmotically-inducible protein OsmY|nr:BON domain-containing protein [Acidobacteriaceae bacterium]
MKKVLLLFLAAALSVPAALAQNDSAIQTAVQKALSGSRFKDIHASVQGGVVTLTGSVDLFATKMNADQKVRHVKGVGAIRDEIQVNGPEISDQELQQKLLKEITSQLWGYVPVQFQAISVQVHNGVVLLGGHAAGPVAASDAVAVVENTKGVKDVIDDLQVDPLSPMDERIRWQEFRSIYGYPVFSKYVMDPDKPIRIQVANGHVTLYGVVANQSEKDAAGIRANSVPGVFSVTNDLQVANASQEKPNK